MRALAIAGLVAALSVGCGRRRFDDTGPVPLETIECDDISANASFEREDSCYTYHRGPVTFVVAQQACFDLGGGRLAALTDADEHDEVVEAVVPEDRFWIGGAEGVFSDNGTFAWSSGEPFSYSNWAAGQPMTGTSATGVVVELDGTWTTANAGAGDRAYLCEYQAWEPGPSGTEIGAYPLGVTASVAERRCQDLGGLPIDPSTMGGVAEVAAHVTFTSWVAGGDSDLDGIFEWRSGEVVPPDQIGNVPEPGDDCLVLRPDGLLRAKACTEDSNVLCARER